MTDTRRGFLPAPGPLTAPRFPTILRLRTIPWSPALLWLPALAVAGLRPAAALVPAVGRDAPLDTAVFADAATRARVLRARGARGMATNDGILAFEALARDRWSAWLDLPLSRILAYRRETASRLRWRRDGPSTVEVLGARRFQPALGGPEVAALADAAGESLDVVFDPRVRQPLVGLGVYRFGPHPLQLSAEALYRFSLGDTVRLTLPGGRTVELVEVRVVPRGPGARLSGSLWIDRATDLVVREGFRFVEGAGGTSSHGDVPMVGRVTMEPEALAVDYGLWDGGAWMPRLFALDATMRIGRLAAVSLEYRRTYSEYRLVLEAGPRSPRTRSDAPDSASASPPVPDSVDPRAAGSQLRSAPDSADPSISEPDRLAGTEAAGWSVVLPADSRSLVTTPDRGTTGLRRGRPRGTGRPRTPRPGPGAGAAPVVVARPRPAAPALTVAPAPRALGGPGAATVGAGPSGPYLPGVFPDAPPPHRPDSVPPPADGPEEDGPDTRDPNADGPPAGDPSPARPDGGGTDAPEPADVHGTEDATLGGYFRVHERPPAFEGADGQPYTVSIEIEKTPDLARPFIGYLVFPRWAETGVGIVGHVETPVLWRGTSRDEVLERAGETPLLRVKEILDDAIARSRSGGDRG